MTKNKHFFWPSGPMTSFPEQHNQKKDITVHMIGWILQTGVLTSSIIIFSGILLALLRRTDLSFSLQTPYTFAHMWGGLLILQPQAIMMLGLLILIATPVVRVAFSIVAFSIEHDRLYAVISAIVLGILIISFTLGKGGA